ncbi:CotH kinase family protein [uncultured Muribaculum sp.]|uniref:CotH kinase family protein n=1 Tax=uncultured Muribaculum sp. TaxID=1918613 RepID=UPI0025ED2AC9|nr:CotH kinase family protein [uncultured Muribaculum sp.]
MKSGKFTLVFAFAMAVSTAAAQTPWLHIYRNDDSFTSRAASEVAELRYAGENVDDWSESSMVLVDNSGSRTEIPLSAIEDWAVGADVPQVYIVTDTPAEDVVSKTEYLRGTLRVDGCGIIADVPSTAMGVRGRGNSTWRPEDGIKLPYRVKFDSKISIGGMKKAKNYVLLANHFDHSLMRNALGMEIARLLGIKYVNTMIPCDVYFNGVYKGSYNLTEKVGINSGSMNDVDEANSVLFELDDQMDETYVFTSTYFNLPVMVKDPDLTEEQFEVWQADFTEAERLVKEGRACEAFDADDLAKYMVMFSICGNRELRFPKSGYIYKTRNADGSGSLYHFGPVWDFDMGFGNEKGNNFTDIMDNASLPLFHGALSIQPGVNFFSMLLSQTEIKAACDRVMKEFVENGGPEKVLEFFDGYAARIRPTWYRDMTAPKVAGWRTYSLDKDYIPRLRAWLAARLDYVTTSPTYGVTK